MKIYRFNFVFYKLLTRFTLLFSLALSLSLSLSLSFFLSLSISLRGISLFSILLFYPFLQNFSFSHGNGVAKVQNNVNACDKGKNRMATCATILELVAFSERVENKAFITGAAGSYASFVARCKGHREILTRFFFLSFRPFCQ